MVEKLKSVSKIIQSQLLLKALVFAGLLFWVKISDFSVLPVLLFFIINAFLYFKSRSQNNSETIRSFVILLFVSLFAVSMLSHFQFLIPTVIFFSFIFYVIIGIKDFSFVHRPKWNYAKNILLSYSVFLAYFLSNRYEWFFGKYLLVLISIFLLVGEWLSWLEKGFPKRRVIISLVFSFIILQLLWVVSLLPLGFINSATLMTVFVYIMMDFSKHHFRGTINKSLVLKHLIVLLFSFFTIYIFTNWKI
jgi:hypothetical protein